MLFQLCSYMSSKNVPAWIWKFTSRDWKKQTNKQTKQIQLKIKGSSELRKLESLKRKEGIQKMLKDILIFPLFLQGTYLK